MDWKTDDEALAAALVAIGGAGVLGDLAKVSRIGAAASLQIVASTKRSVAA